MLNTTVLRTNTTIDILLRRVRLVQDTHALTNDMPKEKQDRQPWKAVALFLGATCLGLLIAMVIILTRGEKRFRVDKLEVDDHTEKTEPENPGVFHDLTRKELLSLQDYLFSSKANDLNLVRPSNATLNVSYISSIDLMQPDKASVLHFLDRTGPAPPRRARVIIFRGDKSPPVVEEYVVGPLPRPTIHELLVLSTRRNPIPFSYRPFTSVEFRASTLFARIEAQLSGFLKDVFNASITDCTHKCLGFTLHPFSSALQNRDERWSWLTWNLEVPYYGLHPVKFQMLLDISGTDVSQFKVDKVIYNDKVYDSVEDLKTAYENGQLGTNQIPFPKVDKNLFSSLSYRGESSESKRSPRLVEPDGKRYTLKNRHVQYMDWQFDFRMSSLSGPQVFNIMYGKDRIAYEISLQEIAVFYSGFYPAGRFSDFVDSGDLYGNLDYGLVPGSDCPETATYIPATFFNDASDTPKVNQRAFCLFEQNTGIPLRRHLSYSVSEGGFYGGVMDTVLILRTILTVTNYDYIFDFIFHQNGAMEVRAVSTGYIMASYFTEEENNKYGFRLHDNILGNIHHHMFHFKADLDILGRTNRYDTLNIKTEDVDNSMWTGNQGDTYNQIYFTKTTKTSEKEAAYKFNFDTPRYHIFHNEAEKTKHGVSRAYRVQMNGMSKQTLRENGGNERTIPWARYQMAVTKFKQDEFCSSSPYKYFDGRNPVVDFQKFIDDNDTIVDEDLVLWLTMGVHHIPHTEDLPITPTPGAHLSFALLPYNYFDEDPSMKSPDTVTVNHKNPSKPEEGVIVRRYHNTTSDKACVPLPTDDMSVYEKDPDVLLESTGEH